MKKQTPQCIKQRVGKLVEQYICEKYSLEFNKRQHRRGYYDAYNKDNIYEIKAIRVINNQDVRTTIILKNHKELAAAGNGIYVVVNYALVNKDKNLQLIQDITINKIITLTAQQMTDLISKHGVFINRKHRGRKKEYVRLKYSYIKGEKNDSQNINKKHIFI